AREVRTLFPTDGLTQADPAQLRGRRIHLPLANCREAPSTCDEINLLNTLDGWSVNPRMTLAFTGRIALDSIERRSAFVLPLGDDKAERMSLVRLVWDAESTTLYARPERTLRQGRPYALWAASRGRRGTGQPPRRAKGPAAALAPRLAKHLGALGLRRDDVIASAVFTTASVTAGLELMRARIDARPAPRIDFM